MARHKLTEKQIKAEDRPGIYGDGEGLYLKVRPGGSKQWAFVWRRGGKRNEIGLGGYGFGTAPVSLTLARQKAEAIRQQLANGENPKVAKAAKVTTFKDCMEALLTVKEGEWRNAKHADQWRMTLREYAKPLHDKQIATIGIDDVVSCLTPHWQERPETADRLRSRIQAVIDYGIARGLRTAGNPARWAGLLDKVMPARQKLSRGHHAALAYKDAPALMAGLRLSTGVAARAVEFTCLTAARTGEARGAVRSEFDLDKAIWTVPAERMKAGKAHVVPLADRAVEIVRAMKQRATSDFVFGGGVGGRPVSDTAMTKALRLASPDKAATLHGLRSMFRDWCGDETQHPREIAEAALAHTIQGVEAAYRRGSALQKRRALMDDWAAYCGAQG